MQWIKAWQYLTRDSRIARFCNRMARCDCGQQLEAAMQAMQQEGSGVLLYLRQEGRGIGLINKLRAYDLQDEEYDTVEADQRLGFEVDQRYYKVAVAMPEDLWVTSIRFLTNNPIKHSWFDFSSIQIDKRVPLQVRPGMDNVDYLRSERDRLSHLLEHSGWKD